MPGVPDNAPHAHLREHVPPQQSSAGETQTKRNLNLVEYTQREYADAIKHLLPPGKAWKWQEGEFGDTLIMGTAAELKRLGYATVFERALSRHTPEKTDWHIDEYRRVALESQNNYVEKFPRETFTVGSHVGDRLWSAAAPTYTAESFPIDLAQVDHLTSDMQSRFGDRGRYVLRVRYYHPVCDRQALWDALIEFKQAHVYLWFEDITGAGGHWPGAVQG